MDIVYQRVKVSQVASEIASETDVHAERSPAENKADKELDRQCLWINVDVSPVQSARQRGRSRSDSRMQMKRRRMASQAS